MEAPFQWRACAIIVCLSLISCVSLAGEFSVLPGQEFVRSPGKPAKQTLTFSAPLAGDAYKVLILNGPGSTAPVTSGTVIFNGSSLFKPKHFGGNVDVLEANVHLKTENELSVTLNGKPGSGFWLQIIGTDDVAPTIDTVVSPKANAAGWHQSPVTVTFTCTDDFSGVSTCPGPLNISDDGRNHMFSVTVEDLAGNETSQTVQISLDQTPPDLDFVYPVDGGPLADAHPIVQLRLTDNLSLDTSSLQLAADGERVSCTQLDDLAHCPLSSGLSAEAPTHLQASVSDHAGNITQAQITLALDSDSDSVPDYADACPDTPADEFADENGCGPSQRDSDGNGFTDAEELEAGSDPYDPQEQPELKILGFSASPQVLTQPGATAQLFWHVQGARAISLRNDVDDTVLEDLARNTSVTVNPVISTRYTLTINNGSESLSQPLELRLELPPEPSLWESPSQAPLTDENIASSLSVSPEGSSYLGSFDGSFRKIDANGELAWTLKNSGLIKGKTLFVEDLIIVGANTGGLTHDGGSGRVYALNADRSIHWTVETDAAVIASPVLNRDGSSLFVASYGGEVLALNVSDGQLLWRYQLPDGERLVASPVYVEAQSALVLHSTRGYLYALAVNATPDEARLLWTRELAQ
ncbi:PQQ-binding-like beta-propeller repeat protein [Marinimicrobium sp. ARAG 43.8]|uniref:outer membrane protein assembly factor BamB family protein n=1 Tax=Marinimicrobium sp. ARAG 43.8 TaxID=3418719 RepID=UPI003CE67F4C